MGYIIKIGEAILDYDIEESHVVVSIRDEINDDAPNFGNGDISYDTNARYPSYSSLKGFCDETGLNDLFYNTDTGFVGDHKCTPLQPRHLRAISDAKNRWIENNPDCVNMLPRHDGIIIKQHITHNGNSWEFTNIDWIYANLVWYEWWFNWALENCERSAILIR